MFDDKKIGLVTRLPGYMTSRAFGTVPPLPMNYTLGLTYHCNSRCQTCRVYERKSVSELTVAEWRKVFVSIGKSPYWITFTGGEPFLCNDILEVYYDLCRLCHPAMVNIPTNGLLTKRVVDTVWQMCKMRSRIPITVNVSIDHVGDKNDIIRGIPGAYNKAVETVKALQALHLDNLSVGVHTVLSRFNVTDFEYIHNILRTLPLRPDLYITEVAENRVELGTTDLSIAPNPFRYASAVALLERQYSLKGLLRNEYYKKVTEWLRYVNHPLSTCYAGHASCQITPDGEVWFCCIRAKSIGNVREHDFRELWTGRSAMALRKDTKCSCPLANAAYTNMLLNPAAMTKIAMRGVLHAITRF